MTEEELSLVSKAKPANVSRARLLIIVGSMYFGEFFTALDSTVVTTLLSHIASDLHELSRVVWIATGYLIAFSACQPLYGKLSDIFGRRMILIFCNLLFAIGCGICGVSNSLEVLVLGRVISGIGGGGMQSLATIAISDLVPLKDRGIFQAVENAFFCVGAGLGGVLGGILSDIMGWRNVFNIQVPFILISMLLLMAFYNVESHDREEPIIQREPGPSYGAVSNDPPPAANEEKSMRYKVRRVDFKGSLLLVLSLCSIMFVISTGGSQFAWTGVMIPSMVIMSVIFTGLFIYVEQYVAKEPVIPLFLFKNPTIIVASFTNLFCTMAMYNVLYFAPIFYSAVFNLNPTQLGQRLSAHFIGAASGSFLSGIYVSKFQRYKTITIWASILLTAGASIIVTLTPNTPSFLQYLVLYLCGTGYSSILTVTLLAYIAAVPKELQAVVTSVRYVFRGTGTTLGVSIASSVFNNLLSRQLHHKIVGPNADSIIKQVLDSVEAIRNIPKQYQPAVISSYDVSLKVTFAVATFFALLTIVSSSLLKEHRLN
jgi:MFS family permease